jgi:wobble nucleotide-excising tRNase
MGSEHKLTTGSSGRRSWKLDHQLGFGHRGSRKKGWHGRTDGKGGRASSSYQLLINEVPVELGDPSTAADEPSFRNTLSSGDRRTLALAFFITQLQLDPSAESRLVVFDDPFTSQDSSRRTCTQQQICRLAQNVKQVFVLSHEASFLLKVNEAAPNTGQVKTLQFARVGPDQTVLAEWDIAEAARSPYERDYFTLQAFLNENHRDVRAVARAIRPMLEGYLRFVCPGKFPDGEWLGDLIGRIRSADPSDPASRLGLELEELEDINDYSKRYHHNTNPAADTEPIDDAELEAYVRRALAFVSAPPRT